MSRSAGRSASLRARVRDERGFTLAEVLSAQLIGGFVLASAVIMVVVALKSSARVTDRVNSVVQGRVAMAEIQQRINSQTCMYSTEYLINSATQSTTSAPAFVYADPTKIAFFTDIGATGGSTGSTSAVGFSPQLRYLYVDPGPSGSAGRKARFVDGVRNPTNSAIPYVFNILPATTIGGLATVSGINGVTPSTARAFADGVTSDVSGGATLPVFSFYDDNGDPITASAANPVPSAQLGDIAQVEVQFRVLGVSGKDSATGGVGGATDNRTTGFDDRFYFKTLQSACG